MDEATSRAEALEPRSGNGEQSVGEGFAAIVARLNPVLLQASAEIGAHPGDPIPVHQTRVALRRLRSALTVFRPVLGDWARGDIPDALRAGARRLGPARAWDVFLDGIGARAAAAMADHPALPDLLEVASRRRDAAYRASAQDMAAADLRGLAARLGELADMCADPGGLPAAQAAALDAPLVPFAAENLARRYKRVRRAGRGFGRHGTAELHTLRLATKRLRYAAEFFAELFSDPDEAAVFIARLSRLQDRLGAVNDAAEVPALLAQLGPVRGGRGFAHGAILGFVAGEEKERQRALRRSWKRFRRLDPFWV